jgi:hypothetical protein
MRHWNIGRGLFRVWVFFAVLWISGVTFIEGLGIPYASLPERAITLMDDGSLLEGRGHTSKNGSIVAPDVPNDPWAEFRIREDVPSTTFRFPNNVVVYASSGKSKDALAGKEPLVIERFVKTRDSEKQAQQFELFGKFALTAFGYPLLWLAMGAALFWSLVWIGAGFRRT